MRFFAIFLQIPLNTNACDIASERPYIHFILVTLSIHRLDPCTSSACKSDFHISSILTSSHDDILLYTSSAAVLRLGSAHSPCGQLILALGPFSSSIWIDTISPQSAHRPISTTWGPIFHLIVPAVEGLVAVNETGVETDAVKEPEEHDTCLSSMGPSRSRPSCCPCQYDGAPPGAGQDETALPYLSDSQRASLQRLLAWPWWRLKKPRWFDSKLCKKSRLVFIMGL
jgi:hypothetical protein